MCKYIDFFNSGVSANVGPYEQGVYALIEGSPDCPTSLALAERQERIRPENLVIAGDLCIEGDLHIEGYPSIWGKSVITRWSLGQSFFIGYRGMGPVRLAFRCCGRNVWVVGQIMHFFSPIYHSTWAFWEDGLAENNPLRDKSLQCRTAKHYILLEDRCVYKKTGDVNILEFEASAGELKRNITKKPKIKKEKLVANTSSGMPNESLNTPPPSKPLEEKPEARRGGDSSLETDLNESAIWIWLGPVLGRVTTLGAAFITVYCRGLQNKDDTERGSSDSDIDVVLPN